MLQNEESAFQLGLNTFGDVTRGSDGQFEEHHAVLRNVVEEAVLADKLGLDFFGVVVVAVVDVVDVAASSATTT